MTRDEALRRAAILAAEFAHRAFRYKGKVVGFELSQFVEPLADALLSASQAGEQRGREKAWIELQEAKGCYTLPDGDCIGQLCEVHSPLYRRGLERGREEERAKPCECARCKGFVNEARAIRERGR